MSRTQKDTVDYFPHDAGARNGDTLTILQNRFGNDGYAFWFKLLEMLCESDGHYIDLRNPVKWQLFIAKIGISNEITVTEMIQSVTELEAIDQQLWESRIIWCQHLVENLSTVYKKRRRDLPKKPIIVDKKAITGTEKPLFGTESTQSKVKKSKVNNNISDFVLPDFIEKETWNDYLEMRVRIKKPATLKAQELAIKELEQLSAAGNDPNEVLKQSIMNSWQGVFPLRDKGRGNGANKNSPVARGVKEHGQYTRPEDI